MAGSRNRQPTAELFRIPIIDLVAEPALMLSGLTKRYGRPGSALAVDDLSLTVAPGEVFAFLGPNGAGKTTTLKLVLGLLRPTAGTATLLGGSISDPKIRARIGYLPEEPVLQSFLTVNDVLMFYAGLFGASGSSAKAMVDRALGLVGMTERRDQRLRELSKGLRQRVLLGQALINDPELVLLDEPQSGLDPVGMTDLRQLMATLRFEGKTVFLNSHQLTEVEQVADRIGIIRKGALIRIGTTAELLGDSEEWVVQITGLTLTQADTVAQQISASMATLVRVEGTAGAPVRFRCANEPVAQAVMAGAQAAGGRMVGFAAEHVNLEQVFLELIQSGGGEPV